MISEYVDMIINEFLRIRRKNNLGQIKIYERDIGKCHCGPCRNANGLFPDPKSCCYFLQCSNCEAHLQKCPPGTHFNPYKLECDWPERAHCLSLDK
ncbi:peritrophin-1-like protein, partial [Dinothrombium tinctorium]